MKNIDMELRFRNSTKGKVQLWKVWQVGGGQGYKVTVGSEDRSNEGVAFSHTNKDRALSFMVDFTEGVNF